MIVRVALSIDAPAERLFELSQDPERRKLWDVFLRSVEHDNDADPVRVGGQVWVTSRQGLKMLVEYTTVLRPELIEIEMIQGPRLFRSFKGSWSFTATIPCQVTFAYLFELRQGWRPFGFVVRAALAYEIRRRLSAFKRFAEGVI